MSSWLVAALFGAMVVAFGLFGRSVLFNERIKGAPELGRRGASRCVSAPLHW
jgi:hypothetical protein